LRQASGKIFALSAEIVDMVKRQLAEDTDHRKSSNTMAGTRSSGPAQIPPIEEVHRDPRYGGDLHRADIAWANMAAATGLRLGGDSRRDPERAKPRSQRKSKAAVGVRRQPPKRRCTIKTDEAERGARFAMRFHPGSLCLRFEKVAAVLQRRRATAARTRPGALVTPARCARRRRESAQPLNFGWRGCASKMLRIKAAAI
jgi:hypothetical protein